MATNPPENASAVFTCLFTNFQSILSKLNEEIGFPLQFLVFKYTRIMKFPSVKTLSFGFMIWAALVNNSIRAQEMSCTPPPAGIVGWWPAEGNANDIIGTNNGTLIGNVTYANGEVGQAFSFNTLGDQVSVSTGGFPVRTSDRTMECWVYINSFVPGGREQNLHSMVHLKTVKHIVWEYMRMNDCFFHSGGLTLEGPVMTTHQWYHVAVTSQGEIFNLIFEWDQCRECKFPFQYPGRQSIIDWKHKPVCQLPNDWSS